MRPGASIASRAVALGLLRFAPEGKPFPGRRGGQPLEAILDVRGAASNLPLRTLLLGSLQEFLPFFDEDVVIGGLSRGGLVLGAQLALVAGRRFVAVLPEGPRASGLQRAVEGDVNGRDVLLFDNIVGSGESLVNAAGHIHAAGGRVIGALAVGTYDSVPTLSFPIHVLFTIPELRSAAQELGLFRSSTRTTNEVTS